MVLILHRIGSTCCSIKAGIVPNATKVCSFVNSLNSHIRSRVLDCNTRGGIEQLSSTEHAKGLANGDGVAAVSVRDLNNVGPVSTCVVVESERSIIIIIILVHEAQ